MSFSGSFRSHCPGERRTTAYLSQHTHPHLYSIHSLVAGRSAGTVDKGEWTSTLAYSSAAARKKVYEQSIDVNEIFLAVWCLSHHSPPPRSRHPAHRHTHNHLCTHCEQKHNPLLPGPSLPPAQTDQNFPWVAAQRYGAALARRPALPESWVARCLLPSPPFPDPNGDVSGSAWEGPDLPGTSG